nr:echinolectin 1-like [Lytechinus pictus]
MSTHGKTMKAFLALLLTTMVIDLPDCVDAKGVRSPTPTDEFLASFFEPSSSVSEANDGEEGGASTTTATMATTTASSSGMKGRDGVVDLVDQLAEEIVDSVKVDEMQEKMTRLESRVSDLERSSNKLKKLALAAMSVALADDGETCSEAEALGVHNLMKGFPAMTFSPSQSSPTTSLHQYCDDLGTSMKPAVSCNQLKLTCNKPSGHYYLENGYFTEVFCEMELFGGGWARYGKANKQNVWNFIDEDLIEVRLQVMEPSDIKEMIDMKYNTFKIHTDVTFSVQADDSTNPSRIHARILPWFNRAPFYIDGFGENFTRLEFLPGGNRITCRNTAGTSHKCGWGEVPKPNEASEQVLIESVYFGPRSTSNGAMTYMGSWQSNKYTWNGSYYYVYAK